MDDSRIRKEKVADSKISGYVWTGPYKEPRFNRMYDKFRFDGDFFSKPGCQRGTKYEER